ncbi:hypothetical protein JMJ58_14780 [Haloterrigena salifodinae]|uniref:Uncharacterized protein n=1 Tax=Haloterrigena salifodinae TaxID=2675099 RepID=A0A8T8DX90_9EURY|nr:hypothetical protein [Haloterrigena salifodinae]QRV14198.1 hypothetical protein JMJ58_14780 [Haloterrigena salifodinae]
MPEQLPTAVADESPAICLIYKTLEADGLLSQSQRREDVIGLANEWIQFLRGDPV